MFVPERFDPVTDPVAAILDGVILPNDKLIAGVVVVFSMLLIMPLAVDTDMEYDFQIALPLPSDDNI